jgi:uncharacterized protein YuzE
VTNWTYDETTADDRVIPLAGIYLTPPDDQRQVRTIDLMGAHVLIDVDLEGNLVSVEIIGPAVFVRLQDLGEYLGEPATALKAAEE